MNHLTAAEIADLINTQNELSTRQAAASILRHPERYIVRVNDGHVVGVIEVKQVQWYQCEVLHLSVAASARRQGLGRSLVEDAEARAKELGARVAQCTIRVGNEASEAVFIKRGFVRTAIFHNTATGNNVAIYQKVL